MVSPDRSLAAAYIGVHRDTLYEWVTKAGEIVEEMWKAEQEGSLLPLTQEQQLYLDFSDTINKADAAFELGALAGITKIGLGAAGKWQALAWRLQQQFRAKYPRYEAQPVAKEDAEADAVKVEEEHRRELAAYEPERVARFIIGLKEAGLIGQEIIDAIIDRGCTEVSADEVSAGDDNP